MPMQLLVPQKEKKIQKESTNIFCCWFFVLYKSAERVASSFYSMFCIAAAIFEEQSWRHVQVCAVCANMFWNCSFFLILSFSLFPCVLIMLFLCPACLACFSAVAGWSAGWCFVFLCLMTVFNVFCLFPMLVYGSSFYVSYPLWASYFVVDFLVTEATPFCSV